LDAAAFDGLAQVEVAFRVEAHPVGVDEFTHLVGGWPGL